jgi:hypothetical protein
VTLSGRLTLDGREFPAAENRNRGTVHVNNGYGRQAVSSELGSEGPAEFSARVFAGDDYRVGISYACASEDNILPCGEHTFERGFDLTRDRTIERDLRPIELAGTLRANGTELESLDRTSQISLETAHDRTVIRPDNPSGGTFSTLAFPGTYRVAYSTVATDCSSEDMPCGFEIIHDEFEVRPNARLDLDLETIDIGGRVSYEGIGVSSQGVDGRLHMRHGALGVSVPVNNGRYGPVRLLDRAYVTEFETYTCRQASAEPCMPYLVAGCER